MNIYPIPYDVPTKQVPLQLYYRDDTLSITSIPVDIRLAGDFKQNNLVPENNLQIISVEDHQWLQEISTIKDWTLHSITLGKGFAPLLYKNLETLSTVYNTPYVPLIKVDSEDMLAGELLMKVKLHGDVFFNHHYFVTISDFKAGNSMITGGSGSNVKAAIVKVDNTIGLFYQSTDNETPEEIRVYFIGWKRLTDDSLLNKSLPKVSDIKFLARA